MNKQHSQAAVMRKRQPVQHPPVTFSIRVSLEGEAIKMGEELMKKLIVIILLTMVLFALGTAPQTEALSCAPPQPVKQEMERSTVVFKGKVIDIKNGLTVFQVEEAWKGVEESTFEIYDNGWDPFIKGTDYLVFGSVWEGKLRTNLCGRTGPWNKTQEDAMKETNIEPNVFKKEAPLVAVENSEQSMPQMGLIILAIVLFLILLSFVVVWRRKNRRTD